MKIALEVVEDLVVAKVGVLRQIKNRLLLAQLVVLLVEDFDLAAVDEVHLFDATLVADDGLAGVLDAAVEADD